MYEPGIKYGESDGELSNLLSRLSGDVAAVEAAEAQFRLDSVLSSDAGTSPSATREAEELAQIYFRKSALDRKFEDMMRAVPPRRGV